MKEQIKNICDKCGENLIIREHDNEKDFRERLMRFKLKQAKYREAYLEQGIKIIPINAEGSPQDVMNRIVLSQMKI